MLTGKIALVTGGSSGIGKEIVKQLLQNNCFVYVNYGHNEELKNKAEQEFQKINENFKFIKADVSKELEVSNMFKKIEKESSKLDFLINNAGTNTDNFIENFSLTEFKKIIDVNLIGKVSCTKYSLPLLKKSNNPCIINIASRLGIKPCIEASAYCASEAGVINFTKASALELAKYKIRVNSISPGLTNTPLALLGWTKEEIEYQIKTNPLKRIGEPIDIANLVLFLISDKAIYINGENINVNGGSLLT